jgi:hypothetical protein
VRAFCFDYSVVSAFTEETQASSLSVLRCDWGIHCYLCGNAPEKSKPKKQFTAYRAHPWALSEPGLRETFDSLASDANVENIAWNFRKFSRKFWNCKEPSFSLNKIITHCRWQTTSLFIDHFYNIVLKFLHSLHYGRNPHMIQGGLLQHLGFNVNEADKNTKFTAGRNINQTTLCGDKNKHRWPIMSRFTRQWVMWWYHTCVWSPPLSN